MFPKAMAGLRPRNAFVALAAQVRAKLGEVAACRNFQLLLLLILVGDAGLAGLDLAFRYAVVDGTQLPSWFNLSEDRSLGELYEYGLTALGAAVMALTFRRTRSPIFAVASFLFVWLTLDNSIELHERVGMALAPFFSGVERLGFQAADAGESLLFLLVGALLVAGTVRALRRGRAADNILGLLIVAAIASSGVFGVAVDLAHSDLHDVSRLVEEALGFVEDFGELLALSVATALALHVSAAHLRTGKRGSRAAFPNHNGKAGN